jgi:hypothetical protein
MDQLSLVGLLIASLVCAALGLALMLARRERSVLRARAEQAEQRSAALEPYRVIPNAEIEGARIIDAAQGNARQALEAARAEASGMLAKTNEAAQRERAEAEEASRRIVLEVQQWRDRVLLETEELRQRAAAEADELSRRTMAEVDVLEQRVAQEVEEKQRRVESMKARMVAELDEMRVRAQFESEEVVRRARSEAEKIAGDALDARARADEYARAAKAMRNIVEGYGDAYLVPTQSLLDDLAADFDHKEAGQRLKTARERSRAMVQSGRAGLCSYKEARRRETAVRFVVDAFNGKVDSLLSKVKHDNYGTLEQGIRDALALVNFNGEAFRDAKVTDAYLEARLDELRWAVRAMELQRLDREEQRLIKEQLREEERARREYEKAIKAAEKEEKTLQKAMEEVRRRVEEASASQRAELERQLDALQRKLVEAEAKNQRALSMAQQTRRGHVYVISNVGSFGDDVYKIGLTRRLEPLDRVKELGDASVPFEFDVHAMIWAEDAPALESALHRRFAEAQVNKVNFRKEFFRIRLPDIRQVVTDMKLECHWTMSAEAREYRESVAIERRAHEASASDRLSPLATSNSASLQEAPSGALG